MSLPVLGYWKIRGLAQPIRLLMHYVGLQFKEDLYERGPAPDFNREGWLSVKYKQNLDFPNLPYYIDGNVRLTQSNTILRYLAKKYNLDASTDSEKIHVDLMADVLMDFRQSFGRLCMNPAYETLKVDYINTYLPETLKHLETFLGNKTWLAGDKLTFVDFVLDELLYANKLMVPNCLDAFPKLRAFKDRFQALPAIKKIYESSPEFTKYAVNNKIAVYQGFPQQ